MVIAIARSWLGTPYHDQASLRGVGCDCLGLARGVWREVVGRRTIPDPALQPGLGRDRAARGAGRRCAPDDAGNRARLMPGPAR